MAGMLAFFITYLVSTLASFSILSQIYKKNWLFVDIWLDYISVFICLVLTWNYFVYPVGNCVWSWLYDAQKYGSGIENQMQVSVVIKTKLCPYSINGAYCMTKWLRSWIRQKSSIDQSQHMPIQSIFSKITGMFWKFSIRSLHILYICWILSWIFSHDISSVPYFQETWLPT